MTYRHPSGVHYVKRKLGALGKVERTLGTTNQEIARTRERMLLSLADRGRLDLVRAWLDGRLGIDALQDAYESSALAELTVRLARVEVSLAEAIEATLVAKAADVAPSTLERYRTGLAHFRRLVDAPLVVDALTTKTVNAFKGARVDEGAARETVNNDLQAVSVLATEAVDSGWIARRPKIKKFKGAPKTIWLEAPDIAAYMANIRPVFRPLMEMLIGTGVRLGEAENLRVCDVRFSADGCMASIEDAKTPNGVRIVLVPDWCADGLRARIERESLAGTDKVFALIPRRTVQKEHARSVKAAGIRSDYTIHRHRDTFGVSMARAGMPLGTLQHHLGHGLIEQTMKYAKFHPEYQDAAPYFKKAADRLGLGSADPNRQGEVQGEVTGWEGVAS